MTVSAAAGWWWAVWWLLWQPASNPAARGSCPGMKSLSWSLRPQPTTPQPPVSLHLSAGEHQCSEPISKRQKWWKCSANIPEIPSVSTPWQVWQWMRHDAWRPAESRCPWSLIWRPRCGRLTFLCYTRTNSLSPWRSPEICQWPWAKSVQDGC